MKTSLTSFRDSENLNRYLRYLVFFVLFFGVKLWLVRQFGNPIPFWDQWDGEAGNLYKPYLDGTLGAGNLFAPHNEHRIFTTRIVALALLAINKSWNPLLQMVFNAGVHALVLMYCIRLLEKVTGRKSLPALLAFTFVVFAVPYAWENSLAGFQLQFYLVFFFSVATLWHTISYQPFTGKWWTGIFLGVLAFLSLASGIFVIAAAAGIGLLQYITGTDRNRKRLLSVGLLLLMFAIGAWLTPALPHHVEFKAKNLTQFLGAMSGTLSWPMKNSILSVVVRNAPALVFLFLFFRKKRPAGDRRWFIAGMIAWMLCQSVSIAY
ncbi:MAG: hypothetical protein EOO05_22320, partial [Chitinophagaceae bacterium]